MTKIDEVARAILKARFYDCEPEMYGNDLDAFFREIDADHIVDAHDEARAAIEAMREPTLEMMEDGDRSYRATATSGISGMTIEAQIRSKCVRFGEGWRAAIDVALSEEGR